MQRETNGYHETEVDTRPPLRIGVSIAYVIATISLLYPAIVNGFPLVMGDTWRYVGEAGGNYSWVSSQYYGYFLRAFSGSSLWLVVVTQALLVVYVIDAFLRRVARASPLQSATIIVLVAVSTPAALFTSLIMTDVLFGVGLIATGVLLLGDTSTGTSVAMSMIVAFTVVAHPAALPLLVLAAATGWLGVAIRRIRTGNWGGADRIGVLSAAIVVAVIGLTVNNAVVWGRATPSAYTPTVAFAYLLTHGDLDDELAECDRWRYCGVSENPQAGIIEFNRFLFEKRSPLWTELGGPQEYVDEAQAIVLEHITSDPLSYASRVLSSGAEQLWNTRASEHVVWMMERLNEGHLELLSGYSIDDVERFAASRQYQKTLDLGVSSIAGIVLGWLGAIAALAGGAGWMWARAMSRPWPERRSRVALGALLLLGFYVSHAFVIATTTYPVARYGGRVLWILGLGFWIWALEGLRSMGWLRTQSPGGGGGAEKPRPDMDTWRS